MGTVIEIRAIIQMVKGKPSLFGHLELLSFFWPFQGKG